jgi:anti-sigma factor RsiW
MTCREAGPLLHARLDNELDMAGAAGIDLHLSECRACAAQYAALGNLHEEIIAADLAYAPGPALERKLASQFIKSKKPRFTFFMATAAAAACAVVAIVAISGRTDALDTEILDNHLRSLQPMHQVDVPSSDRHTVKPWFQGKLNFSPPVPDLSKDNFILIGGRLEVVNRQPAAAIVYRRGQHIVSLYVSPSQGPDSKPGLHEMDGYRLVHWRKNNESYWAVSDVDASDLRAFAELIRGR